MTLTTDQPRSLRTPTVRLVVDPDGDVLEAARVCEADVFDARFGDGRAVLDEWFATHERTSVFVALVDEDGFAVAAARCIVPGPEGLKLDESLVDDWGVDPAATWAAAGLDPATTWEIASISVRPRQDGVGQVWTAALLHGLHEVTRVNGATAVVAVLDEGARALLGRAGLAFHAFPGCGPRPYCGSPASTPVYTRIDAVRRHQRVAEPETYRLVMLGMGLDGVVLPDPADVVLHPRVLDLRPAEAPAPVR